MVLNPGTIVNTEREVILLKAKLKASGWSGSYPVFGYLKAPCVHFGQPTSASVI